MEIKEITRLECIRDAIGRLTDCVDLGNETGCFSVAEVLVIEGMIDQLEGFKREQYF